MERHLASRGFTDVRWITEYPVSHPFVVWLHEKLGKELSISCISGLVKNLEACKDLLDDPNVESALMCDDDVVFVKDWKEKMQIPEGIPFVNTSVGINFSMLPDGKLRQINNNGGCEVIWMNKEFAKTVLDNVDGRAGIDHVYFALLREMRFPLICSPIAQQTSLLCPKSSSLTPSNTRQTWMEYLNNFKKTGLVYSDLWKQSNISRDLEKYKNSVEEDFFNLYDLKIDIQNWDYIQQRAHSMSIH
jgi:hypothetical protein